MVQDSDDRATRAARGRRDYDEDDDDRGFIRRFLDWCWDTVRTWGPALLTVLLIRSVVAEPFRIPSGSMVPTLLIGDHILVTKYSYGLKWPLTRIPIGKLSVPQRGDVIVFVYPGSDDGKLNHWVDLPFPPLATYDYIKRVVGLPGDTIQVRDNVVYINGQAQKYTPEDRYKFVNEQCISQPTREEVEDLDGKNHDLLVNSGYGQRMADFGPVTVPEDHVFVMGDNRDHSSDSRIWGFVPLRNIKGKAQFIWLSYDQCKTGWPIFGTFRGDRFAEAIE